jgi:hypothetical protein
VKTRSRNRARHLAVLVLVGAGTCAGSADVPDLAAPFSASVPGDVAARVEHAIERSVPEVSYQRPASAVGAHSGAAALDPSGVLTPVELRQLIRSLESLDGNQRIVCVPSRQRAFGDCVFPQAAEPRSTP